MCLARGNERRRRRASPSLAPEGGFGLVELLIAMTILSIGIMAIVAGFSAGFLAVNRASRTSTAGTIADRQMEAYRALPNARIALNSALGAASDALYTAGVGAGNVQT